MKGGRVNKVGIIVLWIAFACPRRRDGVDWL